MEVTEESISGRASYEEMETKSLEDEAQHARGHTKEVTEHKSPSTEDGGGPDRLNEVTETRSEEE